MTDVRKLLGVDDLPAKDDPKVKKRKADAKKALKKLWAAGAAGAFFSAIIKSLPVDVQQITWHPERIDWRATWDHIDRYGYLGWLLVYFFFSTFNSEQADDQTERSDLFFHIVQSVFSFTAAYYLGFIVAGTTYGLLAYFSANVAIVVICGLSLCLFHEEKPSSFNTYRTAGLVLSGISVALAVGLYFWGVGLTVVSLVAFFILLVLLCGVLAGFAFIMVRTPQVRAEGATQVAVAPAKPVAPVSAAAVAPEVPASAAGKEKPAPKMAPEVTAPEGGGGA